MVKENTNVKEKIIERTAHGHDINLTAKYYEGKETRINPLNIS